MELDEEAARTAVQTVAGPLDMSVEEAAEAILDIVNENMHAALRVVSVERGYDPAGLRSRGLRGCGADARQRPRQGSCRRPRSSYPRRRV